MEYKSIGAFWKKTSKKGNIFYSGNVEVNGQKVKITMFPNNRKTEDRHPDFNIYLDTYEGGQQSNNYQGGGFSNKGSSGSNEWPPGSGKKFGEPSQPELSDDFEDTFEDDIPF